MKCYKNLKAALEDGWLIKSIFLCRNKFGVLDKYSGWYVFTLVLGELEDDIWIKNFPLYVKNKHFIGEPKIDVSEY